MLHRRGAGKCDRVDPVFDLCQRGVVHGGRAGVVDGEIVDQGPAAFEFLGQVSAGPGGPRQQNRLPAHIAHAFGNAVGNELFGHELRRRAPPGQLAGCRRTDGGDASPAEHRRTPGPLFAAVREHRHAVHAGEDEPLKFRQGIDGPVDVGHIAGRDDLDGGEENRRRAMPLEEIGHGLRLVPRSREDDALARQSPAAHGSSSLAPSPRAIFAACSPSMAASRRVPSATQRIRRLPSTAAMTPRNDRCASGPSPPHVA